MHGGSEVIIACLKYMEAGMVEAFVSNTNEAELVRSLQNDRDEHLHGYCEIVGGFDKDKGSNFVRIRFSMEVEDMQNIENWCVAEGFEIVESRFGSRSRSGS